MNDPMGADTPLIQRKKPGPPKGFKKGVKRGVRRVAAPASDRPAVYAEAPLTRNSPRPAPPRAESARDVSREPSRRGARIAVGRDGEQLTRRRVTVGDNFDVPENEIPAGWTYQWNTVAVLNRKLEEIEQGDLRMHENGWRPVPASRHPGRWTPVGYEGSIIIDGLRLEERPESLTQWAQEEDVARGRALVRDRTDALRLTQKSLPGAQVAANRGQAGGMKMDIDFGKDIPRPGYDMDGDAGIED